MSSSLLPALLSTIFFFSPSSAIKCFNCRTMGDDGALICDSHCEGDICALWNYREMSTNLLVQGCLRGADFRSPSSRLKMGCRHNVAGAQLCLCRDFSLCNSDIGHGDAATETNENDAAQQHELMMPMDIRCHSHTWASFITRQLVRPLLHGCQSNLCFFTETNVSRPSSDDPLRLPRIDSSISRSCGSQREFNFDLLLGPLWPGNGLHSDACYQLEDERGTTLGCSCSNNDCNRQVPYPIDSTRKRVRCHLDRPSFSSSISLSNICIGHFCFVQSMAHAGYDGQLVVSKGCLSTNESAARTSLKVGYRNILGVEQWLCQNDFCNSMIESETNSEDEEKMHHFLPTVRPNRMDDEDAEDDKKSNMQSAAERSLGKRTSIWSRPTAHLLTILTILYLMSNLALFGVTF